MTTRDAERIKLEIDETLGGTKDNATETQPRKKEVQNEKNDGLSHHIVRSCILFHAE